MAVKRKYPVGIQSFERLRVGEHSSGMEVSAPGRCDLTLKMPQGIYMMELKYDDTADAALDQIDRKGYAEKYALEEKPVTKVGIAFSSEERNITEWKAA